MMWVITFAGKPATLEQLHKVERRASGYVLHHADAKQYLAARTKRDTIALFLYNFGFTWAERAAGIGVARIIAGTR